MKEKTILHSDVNNFFASVECATNPELFGKPVAVTGNPEKRTGIILAKNEIAKKNGVKTGEAIWQAMQKCPNLVTVGPHYDKYEKISKQLHEIYLEYTDFVEPLGLDECWLDVTQSLNYLKMNGEEIANEIREKIKKKFGFTVSVGVSFSKLFAKLGSDMKKPDATTTISKESFKSQTYHLPLNSIVGIGHKLELKFEKINIKTIGEFVELKENFVKDIMGKNGTELQLKLKGEFHEEVACYYDLVPPKSIGNGTTTIVDIKNRDDIMKVVGFLSEKVALRMANGNFQGSTITVSLKTNEFEKFRHSKTISPIKTNEEIAKQAIKVVDEFWDYGTYIRSIRIRMSNLKKIDKIEQLSFFNKEEESLNKSLQELKNKYGNEKIFIASDTFSFINRKNKDDDPSQS